MKPTKLKPHYSGPKSEKFWARINALPTPQRNEAYSLGVVLQTVEGKVLRLLELLDQDAKVTKKKRQR